MKTKRLFFVKKRYNMSYLKKQIKYSIHPSDKAWKVMKAIVIASGITMTLIGGRLVCQGINDKKQFVKKFPQSEFAQSNFPTDKSIVGGALAMGGLCIIGIGCLAKRRQI
jgi:hypothetical protein